MDSPLKDFCKQSEPCSTNWSYFLLLITLLCTLAVPGKGPLKAGGYMGNRRDLDSVPVLLRKHHQGCPFLCHAWLFPLAASLILHLLSILACCGFLTTLLGNERRSLYFFGLRVFLFERLPPPTEITIIVLAWPFQKQTHANFCLVNNSVFVCVILIQKRYEDNFDEEASEACLHGWLFGGGPE